MKDVIKIIDNEIEELLKKKDHFQVSGNIDLLKKIKKKIKERLDKK